MNIQDLKNLNTGKYQRYETMFLAFHLSKYCGYNSTEYISITELGSMRQKAWSDGMSTLVWNILAEYFDVELDLKTIDISEKNLEQCSKILKEEGYKQPKCFNSDSIEYLEKLDIGKPDLYYVDSVDSFKPNAEAHQLKEVELITKKAPRVILLDDNFPGGKTKLSKEFLLKETIYELLFDNYQALFYRQD